MVALPAEYSNKDLALEMQEVEKILSVLERVTMVTSYEKIYDSLTEQLRQKFRLEELQQKKAMDHDALLNKLDHANSMKYILQNSMLEKTELLVDF